MPKISGDFWLICVVLVAAVPAAAGWLSNTVAVLKIPDKFKGLIRRAGPPVYLVVIFLLSALQWNADRNERIETAEAAAQQHKEDVGRIESLRVAVVSQKGALDRVLAQTKPSARATPLAQVTPLVVTMHALTERGAILRADASKGPYTKRPTVIPDARTMRSRVTKPKSKPPSDALLASMSMGGVPLGSPRSDSGSTPKWGTSSTPLDASMSMGPAFFASPEPEITTTPESIPQPAVTSLPPLWAPMDSQEKSLQSFIDKTPEANNADGVWLSQIVERMNHGDYMMWMGPDKTNLPAALQALANDKRAQVLEVVRRDYQPSNYSVKFLYDIRFRALPTPAPAPNPSS